MTFASRSGFTQDVALINDRYASFLLSQGDLSRKEAEYHLDNARASYERWGSRRSLEQVGATHDNNISSSAKSLKKIKDTLRKRASVI